MYVDVATCLLSFLYNPHISFQISYLLVYIVMVLSHKVQYTYIDQKCAVGYTHKVCIHSVVPHQLCIGNNTQGYVRVHTLYMYIYVYLGWCSPWLVHVHGLDIYLQRLAPFSKLSELCSCALIYTCRYTKTVYSTCETLI